MNKNLTSLFFFSDNCSAKSHSSSNEFFKFDYIRINGSTCTTLEISSEILTIQFSDNRQNKQNVRVPKSCILKIRCVPIITREIEIGCFPSSNIFAIILTLIFRYMAKFQYGVTWITCNSIRNKKKQTSHQ